MARNPGLVYRCKCGKEIALRNYNHLKSHLYACIPNKGYKTWQNVFDYFYEKNNFTTPKWLESPKENDLKFYDVDKTLIERFRIKPKHYTLNAELPEFSIRDVNMKF
jgi:hypothetical protein